MSKPTKRILSGVQPSGNLHLGNYLGALRNWVRLQGQYECVFCLVDMHAITLWQDPAALRAHTREVAAAMLAASIMYPARGAVTWKSVVGTNVASDALSNLSSPGVMGGALIALAWLANKVLEHGQQLKAGEVVLTGSVHPPVFLPGPGVEGTGKAFRPIA